MKDERVTLTTFKPAEAFASAAQAEFEAERAQIAPLLPEAEIRHIGGTSVPGALTKGDLDIQVRVRPERLSEAVSCLCQVYAAANEDLWNDEFAAFVAPAGSLPEPTKISVVAIGSAYDRNGAAVWELLAANPALLHRYNDLKRRNTGGSWRDYEDEKAAFFRELLSS